MLANLVNEVIVLIASLATVTVMLNAQEDLDAQFDTKQGALFTAIAAIVLFILSSSPVGVNIAIIVMGFATMRIAAKPAKKAFFTLAMATWLMEIIRLISGGAGFTLGFSSGNIPYMASLIAAIIISLLAFRALHSEPKAKKARKRRWFKRKAKNDDDDDDETVDDEDDDEKAGFRAGLANLAYAYPIPAFTAAFGTVAVIVFIVALFMF